MLRRFKILKRQRDGSWELQLGAEERELLASLADQLDEVLGQDATDPGLRRLSPTAYPDDIDREAEWQVFKAGELRSSRQAHLAILRSTARRTRLDDDEVQAWMQAVNALRLVLGTRLDVSEDEVPELAPNHPDAPAYALYDFLSFLLDRMVDALQDG